MDVLKFSNLIGIKVSTQSLKERRLDYYVLDKKLFLSNKVKVTPINLPMIVPPKDYTNNALGGYILNDDTYKLDIMTNKHNHRYISTISDNSTKLFYLVNNTSKVPFKVNKELLAILNTDLGTKLLLDNKIINELENSSVYLSKYKLTKLTSLKSKLLQPEFVLKIANLYKEFNSIYFPVKLDHRGRLYCLPSYFNYQSSSLAKSLLLFSIPGIINKSDLNSSSYLKSYGANCFVGVIAKSSLESKCQ